MKPNIIEKVSTKGNVEETSMALAFEKARDIYNKLNGNEIIMAFDTLVSYNGQLLGKPEDEEDAINMLKLLSGKKHIVVTGLSLMQAGTNIKVIDFEKNLC